MTSMPSLPVLTRVVRAVIYGLCAFTFAWPLGAQAIAASAGVFAAAGSWASAWLAAAPVRFAVLPAVGLGCALVGHFVSRLLADSTTLAANFEPATFLAFVDALDFGLVAFAFAVSLSAMSTRVRWLAFVEVALGGMTASQLVAEHRHGAINRPFELADPILSAGGDPAFIFYGLGALAIVLLASMLILERSWLRLLLHLLILLLIVAGTGLTVESGLVPRPEPPGGLGLAGKPQTQRESRGGSRNTNDNLDFRDQEPSSQKQTPMAVVLLHDDYSPPSGVYYFRQGAFSRFNGRRLVGSTSSSVDADIVSGFPVDELQVKSAPQAGPLRATIETTVALLTDHTRPFGLEAPVAFQAAQNPNPERFRRIYTVVSATLTADFVSLIGRKAGSPKWSSEDRTAYLELPEDPRYQELAETIIATLPPELADDPMLRAWAVSEWLSKEATYSLRSKHADATDPTADFLFGDKVGYCVHFAHAATFLMRSLGIYARVATGYAVDEAGRQGGSAILIPMAAAHAWPEIYLDGVGWVVVDVHPERTLDPVPEPPDADLQSLLGQLARGIKPLPPTGEPLPYWKDWLKDIGRVLGRASLGILLATLLFFYLVKLWRSVAPAWAKPAQRTRVAYRRELDRLAELGLVRRRGESREAFAERVASELPSLRGLTALHVGVHFGSQLSKMRAESSLPTAVARLHEERGRAFSRRRRLLGLLVPWSWLRVR